MTPNQKAFLDAIAWSEIGPRLLAVSDNGYNVLVGSTPKAPLLFNSYAAHPNIYNKATDSTAAGRYQLLARYYAPYAKQLGLHDFSPASQDAIALQQIKECGALAAIDSGAIRTAIVKCRRIWASLPSSPYGQHTNLMEDVILAYTNAGGTVEGDIA